MDARISDVIERNLGSALTANTSIGASTITVADATEFDDTGTLQLGAEIVAYTDADEETGIITLSSTLASTHSSDDPVYIYPLSQERVAYLIAGDNPQDEEGMAARVPHALWDKIPAGIRDWTNGEGETVQADFIGDELVILELVGQDPVIDGSFIDSTTLPPNPSDGSPPASSPTPTVRGGIGALVVSWTPIINADFVTYKVYVSATNGFTPGAGDAVNPVATEAGSLVFIRHLDGGTTLTQGVTYYVKIVAHDVDGDAAASTQGSGAMAKVDGAVDIVANSIITDAIAANAITAEKLAALIVIAGTIATATTGSRVELTAQNGITLYDSSENVLVSLPIDGTDPTFRGNVITGGLTVLGNMLIQGADNHMDKGSVLTLNEGQADPSTAPVVSYGYEKFAFPNDLDYLTAGLGYNTSTSKFYSVQDFASSAKTLVECNFSGSTIVTLRTKNLSTDMTDAAYIVGCGIIGTDIWIGYVSATSKLKAAKYDLSTLTFQTSVTLINSAIDQDGGPGFNTDGTNMIYCNWSGTGSTATVQIRTFNTSGTQLSSNNTTGGLQRGSSVRIPDMKGLATDGTDYWIQFVVFNASGTLLGTYVEQYNASTFAHVSNKDTYIKNATLVPGNGIAWDGTHMRVMASYGIQNNTTYLATLGDLLWDDGTGDVWYVAYEWADATPHLTLPSPIGSASAANTGTYTVPMRRGRVTITNPDLPTGITAVRIFADHGSSPPASSALNRQTTSTYIDTESGVTHIMKNFDSGGSAPDTSNTFPGGTSTIQGTGSGITAPWELGGDGKIRVSNITVAQRLASPDPGDIAYDSDAESISFYAQEGAGLWAPVASRMAIGRTTFEVFDDLLGDYDNTQGVDRASLITPFGNNGGSAVSQAGVSGHVGILRTQTGTTSNSTGNGGVRIGVTGANAPILLGSGVVRAACLIKSPGTLTLCSMLFGLTDVAAQTDPAAVGYRFRWNNAVNSNRWQRAIAGTYTDTGFTAVTINTWYLLEIVVAADATSAEFFINGTSVGSSSGSAQTGAPVQCGVAIAKDSSTTTSRVMDIDFIGVAGEINVARY